MSTEIPLEFPITDPYNVPVTFASELLGIGSFNGVVNVTLGAARFTPSMSGVVDADRVIVSRLRLDLVTATALRDALTEHIEPARTRIPVCAMAIFPAPSICSSADS